MPVKNYETYCEISNYGNIRSIRTGKLRKLQKHVDGYYCLIFYVNGKSLIKYLHRLIAETFIPNPNNLPEVNSKMFNISKSQIQRIVNNKSWKHL